MIILPYLAHAPQIDAGVTAHPSAAVIGRTQLGAGCTLGELTLLRADGEDVTIGADCWFGEASTVHIADLVYPAVVGAHVTVGRFGLVHACTVGDDCVIGEHAVVMDGSVLGAGAVIAAESVVPPGKILEGGWLYAGVPARPVERVPVELLERLHRAIRGGAGVATTGDSAGTAGSAGAASSACVAGLAGSTGAAGLADSAGAAVAHILAAARAPRLRRAPGSGLGRAFAQDAYVAPSASLAGKVEIAPRASVWFGVEVDAGASCVEIGEETNVQDNSRLYGGGPGEDIKIGERVIIGHNVRIFASTIEDDAIIGMGAIIGKGTIVRAGGCVAAGSITEPGTVVVSGEVWSGRPARSARVLSSRNREEFSLAVQIYVGYSRNYLAGAMQAAATR